MKLKQYPKYNESEIQWIGKIPQDWETRKISDFLKVNGRVGWKGLSSSDYLDEGYALFTSYNVYNVGINNFNPKRKLKYIPLWRYDESPEIKVKLQDILLAKIGGRVGFVYNLIKESTINSSLLILRNMSKRILPKFGFYYLNSKCFEDYFYINRQGSTMQSIDQEEIKKMKIVIPTIEEQYSIVSFLDKKTSRINSLIDKDKKLIELLKEKRIALINHVVTKGLNPKAKMKDSGIEWIGKIPKGWEVRKFKHFATKLTQGPNPDLEKTVDSSDFKVLKTKDLYDYCIKYEEADCLSQEAFFECINAKLKDNDVLITIVGHGSIGKINIFNKQKQEFIFTRAIALFRPEIKRIYPKYIKFYFESKLGKECLYNLIEGSTGQEVIKTTRLGDLKIILPEKVGEQSSIALFLDKATSKIDITIQKIERKIELLEEYKKSLIHHVVTGKVDVRNEK